MQKSHYRTIFFQLILVTTLKRIMKYYRLAGVSQTTAKLNEIVCLTKTNLAQIAFVTFCFNRDNKKVGKNPLFSWSKLGNFTKLLKRIAVICFREMSLLRKLLFRISWKSQLCRISL